MNIINEWKNKIAQYLNVQIKLIKLGFIERTSYLMGYFIFTIISLFFLLCMLLFLGLGLAEWFAAMVNSRIGGFFMAIGAYFLLFLIFFGFRKMVIRFFASAFINVLTEHDDDDNEEKEANK